MFNRIIKSLSTPHNLARLNGSLILTIVGLNIYIQGFCIPTTWAILLLVVCFVATIFYPLLETSKYSKIISFINGISFIIFVYCILFLEQYSLIAYPLSIVGIGLILLIPQFIATQLLWKNLIKPKVKSSRVYFMASIVICSLMLLVIGNEYKKSIVEFQEFERTGYTTINKSYLNERILGMHFLYHTRIEMVYDGWRPPIHDPILIVGMWMNNRVDPLAVDLRARIKLYQSQFPENRIKLLCSCALQYSDWYHNDDLWKDVGQKNR